MAALPNARPDVLHFRLLGVDSVFDSEGNPQVLEVNHTPELFCNAWEGAHGPKNNAEVVDSVARVLDCWRNATAKPLAAAQPLELPRQCDLGLDPQIIYKGAPTRQWSVGPGNPC